MIDRAHKLSVTKQTKALGISRGCLYYRPKPISEDDQHLMKRLDQLHMELPFAGARMLRGALATGRCHGGPQACGHADERMGLEALYRKPRTTQRSPAHQVYPYLLRDLAIARSNQVWAMDITYIPMAKGFVYLVAVVDWYTRRVLAWRLSITMDGQFCLEAVEEAVGQYGKPAILIPIKAVSSRVMSLQGSSRRKAFDSVWMGVVRGAITSLLNVSGDR